MATDPAIRIAVCNPVRYRAESLALALAQRSGYEVIPVTHADLGMFAGCTTVIVDVHAQLESALQLVRDITMKQPEADVILLGMVELAENVIKMAEAGASGYVPPDASLQELVSALEAVRKREFICRPDLTYVLLSHLSRLAWGNKASAVQSPRLTTRERRVMELMSQAFTNKQIAASLCVSPSTIKNHVHSVLKKVGVRSRTVMWHLVPPSSGNGENRNS
jgi:two-component system nitrate/nitrite response regulator NarL